MKKKKLFSLQKWLIQWLRRGSYRTGVYSEVKSRARVSRGSYRCAYCKKLFRNGEYAVDHIAPVVDTARGFVDWNTYISRLYVAADGLQLLCHECHTEKSTRENRRRRKA